MALLENKVMAHYNIEVKELLLFCIKNLIVFELNFCQYEVLL